MITPTWAKPWVAPPPSAKAIFGGVFMAGVTALGGETGAVEVGEVGEVGDDGEVLNSGEEPHPAVTSRKKTVKTLAKMGISGQHTEMYKVAPDSKP